jgi:hypothetical protein
VTSDIFKRNSVSSQSGIPLTVSGIPFVSGILKTEFGSIFGKFRCERKTKPLLFRLSYHVPHQSQLNTQSSRLSPRTPSLLENPLTFFTNTRHPSQRYHLSFSTKKDCIFSRNTVVNIDVAPRLPVCHIIT